MNNARNLLAIRTIAKALSDLNLKVAYIGGAAISLYSNAAAPVDKTESDDVDVRLEIASLMDLEILRKQLAEKGFTESSADMVSSRFHYEGIIVDVMSMKDTGESPGNLWFNKGFVYLEQRHFEEMKIIIQPVAFLLATKFNSYHDRGSIDPGTSHDYREICYILENRTTLIEEIQNYPAEVQNYLKEEFKSIINNKLMKEALLEYLPGSDKKKRFNAIVKNLKKYVSLFEETK